MHRLISLSDCLHWMKKKNKRNVSNNFDWKISKGAAAIICFMFNIINNYYDTRTFEFTKMDSRLGVLFHLSLHSVCLNLNLYMYIYIVQRSECISLTHCFCLIFDLAFSFNFIFNFRYSFSLLKYIFVVFIWVYFHLFFSVHSLHRLHCDRTTQHMHTLCVCARSARCIPCMYLYVVGTWTNARMAVTGSLNHLDYLSSCSACVCVCMRWACVGGYL